MYIKLLAAVQSGSVKYPQLDHRSTDYEAMQDSARRLTFKHLSSVSAEPKQLFFIFFRVLTLLELSDNPDIYSVILSITLSST